MKEYKTKDLRIRVGENYIYLSGDFGNKVYVKAPLAYRKIVIDTIFQRVELIYSDGIPHRVFYYDTVVIIHE